jgi:predicted nucleic acid-binding protein
LIVKRLKAKGRPIPTNDIWIAANAMKHGLALYSLDTHFEEIEGLLLLPGIRNGA